MDQGARPDDYQIFVGHEAAYVTELVSGYLTFVPPEDEPDDRGLHSQGGGKRVLVTSLS